MSIELKSVTFRAGDTLIVNNVDLSVSDGELFVLLGASGSGKSSILRLIAGLNNPDSGSIVLNGQDVTNIPPQKRNVGFVLQNYALFPHMTVAKNVEFGLTVRRVSRSERRRKSIELLDMVGLAGFESRFPAQLSGGQKQRVALARALAFSPAILLLDEPFGALDAKIRNQLRSTLKDVQRQTGITTILVTHDHEEAFELGDRIAILRRGALAEVGTAEQLYSSPSSEYSAQFMGSNVVMGRWQKDGVRLGTNTVLPLAAAATSEIGAPACVMFRPEWVGVCSPEQETAGVNLGSAILQEHIFAGANRKLRFELETMKGTRPVEPAVRFGQKSRSVLVSLSSNEGSVPELIKGKQYFLSLNKFHCIDLAGLRTMAYVSPAKNGTAAAMVGGELTGKSLGLLKLVALADEWPSGVAKSALENVSKQLKISSGKHLSLEVIESDLKRGLIDVAQSGMFDLVILPKPATRQEMESLKVTIRRTLLTGAPVLVSDGRRSLSDGPILIYATASEFTKQTITFAARLARHTQSTVNILSVADAHADEREISRINKFLSAASELLEGYGVESKSRLKKGNLDRLLKRTIEEIKPTITIFSSPMRGNASLPASTIEEISLDTETSVLISPAWAR